MNDLNDSTRESATLILKAGDKLPELARVHGDFEDWIQAHMDLPRSRSRVIDIRKPGLLPDVDHVVGIIITGSSAMVTDREDWMLEAQQWLLQAIGSGIPVLGICFGHQLLAQALGGSVDYNPNGVEVGSVALYASDPAQQDPLLGAIPRGATVYVSHRQTVVRLPEGAIQLAHTDLDEHIAFRYADKPVWGVQFHPEFSQDITRAYVMYYHEYLQHQGIDAQDLAHAVGGDNPASAVIRRFVTIPVTGKPA